jgi:hypothetical protein
VDIIKFVDDIAVDIGEDYVVARCDEERANETSAYVSSAEVESFGLRH